MLNEAVSGQWQVEVSDYKGNEPIKNLLKDAFQGEYSEVMRGYFEKSKEKTIKIIRKFLNKKKVPHFLFDGVPMIINDESVVESSELYVRLSFKRF